jgi:hypothetical protein
MGEETNIEALEIPAVGEVIYLNTATHCGEGCHWGDVALSHFAVVAQTNGQCGVYRNVTEELCSHSMEGGEIDGFRMVDMEAINKSKLKKFSGNPADALSTAQLLTLFASRLGAEDEQLRYMLSGTEDIGEDMSYNQMMNGLRLWCVPLRAKGLQAVTAKVVALSDRWKRAVHHKWNRKHDIKGQYRPQWLEDRQVNFTSKKHFQKGLPPNARASFDDSTFY